MRINEIIDPNRSLIEHIRLPELYARIEKLHQIIESKSNNFTLQPAKKWDADRRNSYKNMFSVWDIMIKTELVENYRDSYARELLQELIQYFDE